MRGKGSGDVGADSWFRKLSDYASNTSMSRDPFLACMVGPGNETTPFSYTTLIPDFSMSVHAVEKIGEPVDKLRLLPELYLPS